MSAMCALTASDQSFRSQVVVAARDLGGESGVAELGFARHPLVECGVAWNVDVAGLHLGSLAQQFKRADHGREAVGTASF